MTSAELQARAEALEVALLRSDSERRYLERKLAEAERLQRMGLKRANGTV